MRFDIWHLLVAIIVTVVVVWLCNLFLPIWLAGVIGLVVFIGLIAEGGSVIGRPRA